MSGIPVYTRINTVEKPSGVTPQTAAPGSHKDSSHGPNPTAPATTTASTATSTYSPARPGASAAPAATGAPPPPRAANLQPTPVYHGETDGPPAPQPGAVPTPLNRQHVPPPPKAGEVYRPPQQTVAPPGSSSLPQQPYPPQMSVPPPSSSFGGQPPASSTSISNTASSPYPILLPTSGGGPGRNIERPPGYQQNANASEPASDQRWRNESTSSEKEGGLESDSMWNTLGRMAQQAGAKMAEAEADVWRKINKE